MQALSIWRCRWMESMQDKGHSLQRIFCPWKMSAVDPYAEGKKNCNSDVPCCFVPYLSATSRVLRVFVCDSSIRMCHTPQALDVSSRPPRLRDHVSPPAGEKAFSQRKGGTNQRLYVTCLLPIKESKSKRLLSRLGTWGMLWKKKWIWNNVSSRKGKDFLFVPLD